MKEKALKRAKKAAGFIRNYFKLSPQPIGLILGTGWSEALDLSEENGFVGLPFESIPGFKKLAHINGHDRQFLIGQIANREVIILKGRVHLNEAPFSKQIANMVRLQTELLIRLGVKQMIVTSAVGALKTSKERLDQLIIEAMNRQQHHYEDPALKVGEVAVVDGFVSLYAPDMPLFSGEFCSPDDILNPRLMQLALKYQGEGIVAKLAGLAMMRGPQFEGRKYDKAILSKSGAGVVGMSMYPEACIASLYETEFLGLGFVTNNDEEEHSHETNRERAQKAANSLGNYLTRIVASM